jgi:hypothetical protein
MTISPVEATALLASAATVEVEDEPLFYPDTAELDEQRRAYILGKLYAPEDIDGKILVENMARIEAWLKTGVIPVEPPANRSKGRVVDRGHAEPTSRGV